MEIGIAFITRKKEMLKNSKPSEQEESDPALTIKQILPILKIGRTNFFLRRKSPGFLPNPIAIKPGGRVKFWRKSIVISASESFQKRTRHESILK